MNMGSSSITNCSDDGVVIGEQLYEDSRSKRPEFFACEDCGRGFTVRAMEIHKRSCLETPDCRCSVCKSGAKKLKREKTESRSDSSSGGVVTCGGISFRSKGIAHVKPRPRNLLTGKSLPVKNGLISEDNIITFKFVENHIIDKMVGFNISPQSAEDSPFKFSESAAFNDHKYVSIPPELSENCNAVNNKQEDSQNQLSACTKLSNKIDHDCTRKIFCSVCNEHIHWESFGLHLIQHCETQESNDLKCPGCERVFNKPACILTHFIVHLVTHPDDCNICCCHDPNCIDAGNCALAEHCYADNSAYYCYICLTRFSHNQTVVNHMRLHTNEMPFKCTECSRSFRQIGNLQRHMTTHRGDRPHKCPDCCRSFADPATLRNHLRVHTGETPFVCTICKRGFTQVGNLKRHMALHLPKDSSAAVLSSGAEMISDENMSVIPLDDIKFDPNSTSASVENDLSNKYADLTVKDKVESPSLVSDINGKNCKKKKNRNMKMFPCKICKKVYAWHHDLQVHFRTHTGEKPFKCEVCDKRFAQSGAVRIHKARHHHGHGSKKNVQSDS